MPSLSEISIILAPLAATSSILDAVLINKSSEVLKQQQALRHLQEQ